MALVPLDDGDGACVDRWEASRPDATLASQGASSGPASSVQGVLPWTSVTLAESAAACGEAGKRLCAFDELQRACGGDAGALFPYGEQYDPDGCNGYASGLGKASPCGAFEGCAAPSGIADLSGNVQEWTGTVSPDQNPCVFGGDYHAGTLSAEQNEDSESCAPKGFFCIAYESPESSYNNVGFRCCADVGSAPFVEDGPDDAGARLDTAAADASHHADVSGTADDAGPPDAAPDATPDVAATLDADAGAHPDAEPPVLFDLVIGGGAAADVAASEPAGPPEMSGGCGSRAGPQGWAVALALGLVTMWARRSRRVREEPM
jgi:hypothetical protein